MTDIRMRYIYTNGKNWIMKIFDLSKIVNGEPFEVLSDQPLLKDYKHIGEDLWSGWRDKNKTKIFQEDIVELIDNQGKKIQAICKYGKVHRNIGY